MLTDEVKQSIQAAYRQLLEKYAFTPRHGQRRMIAEITNSLAQLDNEELPPPICVVEAGTGTGKTLAYLLAVLPLARSLQKKVVLTTATVALQEQVINKDLPDVVAGCDLQFSYAMAKGRGRYLCLSRLDSVLRSNESLDAIMDLYGEEVDIPDASARQLYQRMLDEISSGKWEGDRDEWQEPIKDTQWRPVTVDNTQCMGARCAHFSQCFFYKARESVHKVDCIVSNHDLLLSDLALGGGVILPDPQDTIYIIDEAHHLPFKSNNHFAAFTRLKASMGWLQQCEKAVVRLSNEMPIAGQVSAARRQESLSGLLRQILDGLQQALLFAEQIAEEADQADSYGNRTQHTFKLGVVPEALRDLSSQLESQYARLFNELTELLDELKQLADEGIDLALRLQAEQWFPVLGNFAARAEGALKLWLSFARADTENSAPRARWLTITDFDQVRDFSLSSSPVLAASDLRSALWDNCAGAVLTSATLSALGNFDVLAMRSGLPDHTRYLSIPSPFDFRNNARFIVPRMQCEPNESEKHTAYIINALPKILSPTSAALMLFSSRRQMLDVMQELPKEWRDRVLCQDDYQKAQLLKYHRQRVDQGQGSIIFGLASFAEGVDLPGKYCTHVLIAKIPFAVPNDPVELTLSDWLEQQGKNPFMVLAVPEAAFRLVQACGRLLRNETDTGTITLFDERIVNKFYGKAILESLPPYHRELLQQTFSG
ncbi:MAG: ATP-dependent DNA helicase DinG [Pseudohongiellaceae bacterium]